jgi:Transposase DDE domain
VSRKDLPPAGELGGRRSARARGAPGLLEPNLRGGKTIVAGKGYARREFEAAEGRMGATLVRPARRDKPERPLWPAATRQRIESVFHTLKDLLSLERHGARTLENLRARIATRLLALAACVWLNHQLGRPSRSLVAYVAWAR